LVDQLRAIVKKLEAGNVRVQRGNALSVLAAQPAASLDLVFLDPPFDAGLFDKALAAARPALRETGYVYLEAPGEWGAEALARHGLERVRHMRAGAVHGHLLRPTA
jgi:16S rRNA (guanine966-N2)-methyltransferase